MKQKSKKKDVFEKRNNTIKVYQSQFGETPYLTEKQSSFIIALLLKKYGTEFQIPNISEMHLKDASKLIDYIKNESIIDIIFVDEKIEIKTGRKNKKRKR